MSTSSETDWNDYFVADAGRRLGVSRPGWMSDWFTSWSPRNDNSNAEGPWTEWVTLALKILQHDATAFSHPEIHEAVTGLRAGYIELTEDDIDRLFSKDER